MSYRTTACLAASLAVSALSADVFAQGLLPAEGMLTAEAIDAASVDVRGDGTVVVRPSPVGLSGVPLAALRLKAAGPVPHSPDNVLRVRVASKEPVLLSLVAVSPETGSEVFPVRVAGGGDGPRTVYWSFDSRTGSAGDPTEFLVGVGTAGEAATATLDDMAVDLAKNMADADVIAASAWRMLSVAEHQPRDRSKSLAIAASVPRAIAVRSQGAKLVIRVGDQQVHESTIDKPDSGSRALFQSVANIPLADKIAGPRTVTAALVHPDGRELPLGTQTFEPLATERSFRQWEYPHQSIVDYDAFMDGPDIRIVAVVRDQFACAEPASGGTMSHEIHDTTVTTDLSMSQDRVAWRMPAYDSWAGAGFHAICSGDWKDMIAMYVSAGNAQGIDVFGYMSTIADGNMTPSVKNPSWAPADAFSGWTPGAARTLRGASIAPYGRGFVMLASSQVGTQPARLLASVSTGLSTWADAGVVPPFLPEGTRHIDIDWREGIHYLYTDDPSRVWISRDPLRAWEEKRVALPSDWSAFRVIVIEGEDHLFGLADAFGKNVVRWRPIEWSDDESGTPLPKVKETP